MASIVTAVAYRPCARLRASGCCGNRVERCHHVGTDHIEEWVAAQAGKCAEPDNKGTAFPLGRYRPQIEHGLRTGRWPQTIDRIVDWKGQRDVADREDTGWPLIRQVCGRHLPRPGVAG